MNDNNISNIVESVVKNLAFKDMTLEIAKELIKGVQKKAKEIGVNAVVAVSNSGARPVAIECMDNSYIVSFDVALKKAYTVVAIKMPTKELKPLCQPGGPLYGIENTNDGQIVIFGGGEPLEYMGRIIGGLGVSGGSEEQDTYLAEYGKSLLPEILKRKDA